MLHFIDTHCHIHDVDTYKFALSRQKTANAADFTPEKLLERAHAAGIEKLICVGTSHQDALAARDFAKAHDNVFWAYGIHPDEADEAGKQVFSPEYSSAVAIGEVGLDYHHGDKNKRAQIALFEQMLQLASDHSLPVILHIRDAFDDALAVLDNFPKTRGVVHSFSDSQQNLEKSLNRGFYIGVNGLATFTGNLPLPPLDRMLLETDAPFLTPAPFRGTINEPAHIKDICAHISKITGESEARVAEITTKNAEQLFKI